MTPQELKNSILQLAIQGKLVEQRREEGTGEELYQKIQKEKQALIKVGKIKKGKPLPEITEDEVPFEIPETWKWVKLAEICTIATGKRDANFGSSSGRYPFFTCAKEPIRCDSFSFEGESLLLAGNGDIGNISYYCGQFEAYQRTYVLQPYIEMSYCLYLYYHIQANWVQYNMGKIYGTAIPYIRLGNIQNYYVALPPLAEQKRIVAKIEELLPLIDRYEQAWTRLEDFNKRFPVDMQKSILQMAIQGKLVEQRPEEGTGEELYQQIQREKQALIKAGKLKKQKPLPEIAENEVPFEIPETWKWVRLCTIGCTQTGNTPSKSHPEYQGSDVPFISPGDIQNGQINYNNQALSTLGKRVARIGVEGTVLQVCIGGSIGKAAITDIEVTFNQQINAITPLKCESKYLFSVLTSFYFLMMMKNNAGGTATPIINRGLWDSIPVPLPPLAEQKRIVARLEELLPLCEGLK